MKLTEKANSNVCRTGLEFVPLGHWSWGRPQPSVPYPEWEKGAGVNTVFKIAQTLGCSPLDLIYNEEPADPDNRKW